MKKAWIISIASLVVLFGLSFVSRAFAAQDYLLVCNPAGKMTFGGYHDGSTRTLNVGFNFRGAATGSSVKQPGPGECAWVDRGWKAGEPQSVTYYGDDIGGLELYFEGNLKLANFSPSGRSKASREIRYIFEHLRDGTIFYVHAVYDTRLKTLRITRVGP